MRLEPGRRYVATLRVNGLLSGADWVAVPFAQKFPVVLLQQSAPVVLGDGLKTELLFVWRGQTAGEIQPGETIEAISMPNTPETTATIVSVEEDDGTKAQDTVPAVLQLIGAVALLGFVAYATSRIGRQRGTD